MRHHITTLLLLLLPLSISAQLKLDASSPKAKLHMAESAISNLYVDAVDEGKLAEDAIRGMLKELDPHSTYSTPKEVRALTEPLQGEFEGIGVQFNMIEDTLIVIQTITNGPSEKVGILSGDRIIAANDTAIAGVKMDREDVMKHLRGPKGSKVKLTVVRRSAGKPLTFMVTRDKIPVHSVHAAYMIRPQTGYIKIDNFGSNTYSEFMSAVEDMLSQGMDKLIIDLQDNGGGYLQVAAMLANEMLERGDLIVYTEGRKSKRQDYYADGHGTLKDIEVCVLVNELSASASEILAGALQDQDRGMVVGRRSFGKGLVQRPLEFSDGSMIRLTIAHYYTPSGRCIQKPYKKGDLKEYEMDFDNRLKRGELTNRDSIHFSDSLRYSTLKKQRTIYGGGGIMPDEFVPLDTMQYTRFHRKLAAKNLIVTTTLTYVDKNRKRLKRDFPTFERFNAGFEVPASMTEDIRSEAKKKGLEATDEEWQRTLTYLRPQLKALIARDLWDMSEYYQVMNEYNDIVKRAIEAFAKR